MRKKPPPICDAFFFFFFTNLLYVIERTRQHHVSCERLRHYTRRLPLGRSPNSRRFYTNNTSCRLSRCSLVATKQTTLAERRAMERCDVGAFPNGTCVRHLFVEQPSGGATRHPQKKQRLNSATWRRCWETLGAPKCGHLKRRRSI